jgi:hypothetical protein
MMASNPRPGFSAVSTALLISAVALPVSVIAFAVLYVNSDSFWSVVWLFTVLPAIWLAAGALSIRDTVKRRSWRQMVAVVVLLALTVVLANTAGSLRFVLHQLFTFRPLDLHLPTEGVLFMEKFKVCAQEQPCKAHDVATQTRSFSVRKIPDGCCSLAVVNGRGGKNKVDSFRVVVNGKEVTLESQKGAVNLSGENEISVQLSGAPDAYIHVIILYTGKKSALPAQVNSWR